MRSSHFITEEERRRGLATRLARKDRRDEVRACVEDGTLGLGDVLRMWEDEAIGATRVKHVLQFSPSIDEETADELLGRAGISTVKKLDGLSGTKLRALLRLLEAEQLLGPETGPRQCSRYASTTSRSRSASASPQESPRQ